MQIYLPGFELPVLPNNDLKGFDHIFVCVSGGKDSHAMLFFVAEMAKKQKVFGRVKGLYADTGMEWYNAEEHVVNICKIAGVPLVTVKPVRPMIDQIKYRGQRLIERSRTRRDGKPNTGVMFPSPQCRYCTTNQKIDPMDKEIRKVHGRVLKITGERREESKLRAKALAFEYIPRLCTNKRKVWGWRPMLDYQEADIWTMVKSSGVERHYCYDLGCKRLGCAGCIFSGDKDLKIEMRENPHIFEALDKLEANSGFTMSMSGVRIKDRIKRA